MKGPTVCCNIERSNVYHAGTANIYSEKCVRGSPLVVRERREGRFIVYIAGTAAEVLLPQITTRIIVTKHTLCPIFCSLTTAGTCLSSQSSWKVTARVEDGGGGGEQMSEGCIYLKITTIYKRGTVFRFYRTLVENFIYRIELKWKDSIETKF